jgi:NitT/TauT family transport system permease protein
MRITVVVLLAVFPIIVNTFDGARAVRQDHLDAATVFGARRWQLIRTVLVPSGLPLLLAGLRLGLARALIGIVVAELLVGNAGIGGLMHDAASYLKVNRLIVPILGLGALAILLQVGMRYLERIARPWAYVGREI